ncbi:metal-dependent transcriptional regulator [Thermoplasma sp.]|uniref:metal-dependent transcriptional regulator n=1 Tax=Thermoplasma sp. TaxID=1973142 RepID=UPI0012757F7C|nr:metal-dependent transcriptional regulator [Thermoplasma sp.]KAA8923119.1 MAG: metal-dependent transcriptional regulator [Thermoplasma sp.]
MNENRIRTITEEDYLKIMQELVLYRGYATLADISRSLNVRRQSVRDEINHLISLKMVEKIERGKYRLTQSGDREANKFLRKHRTAEILLARCIGIPWERVDEEAMGIEHGMTEEIIQRTIESFGIRTCPHGNPIPDQNGEVEQTNDVRISSLPDRSYARISRIVYETDSILHFLATNGLLPGKDIMVESAKDVIRVTMAGRRIEIPPDIGMAIRVFPVKEPENE